MASTVMSTGARRVPWHLWVVGVVAVLWNGYGAYDYVMTMYGGVEFLRQAGMSEAYIAAHEAIPLWMSVVWPMGVWSAVLGSVLLLARSRWAFPVFVTSLVFFAISLAHNYGMSELGALSGTTGVIVSAMIGISLVFFVWYSRMMTKRGVLR